VTGWAGDLLLLVAGVVLGAALTAAAIIVSNSYVLLDCEYKGFVVSVSGEIYRAHECRDGVVVMSPVSIISRREKGA